MGTCSNHLRESLLSLRRRGFDLQEYIVLDVVTADWDGRVNPVICCDLEYSIRVTEMEGYFCGCF